MENHEHMNMHLLHFHPRFLPSNLKKKQLPILRKSQCQFYPTNFCLPSLNLTLPLKINGWKMKFLWEDNPLYTPWKIHMQPCNHPIEKENHLNQTFILEIPCQLECTDCFFQTPKKPPTFRTLRMQRRVLLKASLLKT